MWPLLPLCVGCALAYPVLGSRRTPKSTRLKRFGLATIPVVVILLLITYVTFPEKYSGFLMLWKLEICFFCGWMIALGVEMEYYNRVRIDEQVERELREEQANKAT